MLEESKGGSPVYFNPRRGSEPSNRESLPSLPASGEVITRITGVRKIFTNYDTYIAYQIETVANHKEYPSEVLVVERRYREFDWLYSRFLSIYAVLFVPPLPGKKVLTQFNRYASGFVDRRCSGLQTFLHKSASHPIFSSNPDFIAFLTLSRNDFQIYMQKCPIESSLLSSLIGQQIQVPPDADIIRTTGSSEQQSINTANASSTVDVSPPSSNPVVIAPFRELANAQQLRQASEKFARHQIEVIEYIALCQCLSSLVSRMTSQLATLSYDHAELAKVLEEAGKLTAVTSSSSTTNAQGGWASALVGSAMRRTARATHALASKLSNDSACSWHEKAAFGEAVKRVLKNRQAIQAVVRVNVNEAVDVFVCGFDAHRAQSGGVVTNCIGRVVCKDLQNFQGVPIILSLSKDSYFSLDQEIKERQRIEAAASEDVMYQHPQTLAFTDSAVASIGGIQSSSTSHKWLARFTSIPWGSNSKKKNKPISEVNPL